MNVVHISVIIIAIWFVGRGILELKGMPTARQRYQEKPWFQEYNRACGWGDILIGGGLILVSLVLNLTGVSQEVSRFEFFLMAFPGMVPGMAYLSMSTRKYDAMAQEEADSPQGLFQRFRQMDHDLSLLALEQRENAQPYFCYPRNATPIGYEGSVMYCFLEPYGDTVFAVNPENFGGPYVYPLAEDFRAFLQLVLACGSANPVEHIPRVSRDQFIDHLCAEEYARTQEHKDLLELLARIFDLTPMEAPYDYVRDLQGDFDDSQVDYPESYYDTLGLPRP